MIVALQGTHDRLLGQDTSDPIHRQTKTMSLMKRIYIAEIAEPRAINGRSRQFFSSSYGPVPLHFLNEADMSFKYEHVVTYHKTLSFLLRAAIIGMKKVIDLEHIKKL